MQLAYQLISTPQELELLADPSAKITSEENHKGYCGSISSLGDLYVQGTTFFFFFFRGTFHNIFQNSTHVGPNPA